ncbi:MAG: hypothetical protein FWH01_04110 [Oscillospiraceae bacterium]|nr:hypothetical protein [Oscillospiraceae bacterium]
MDGTNAGQGGGDANLSANATSLPRDCDDLTDNHWEYLIIMEASTGYGFTRAWRSKRSQIYAPSSVSAACMLPPPGSPFL